MKCITSEDAFSSDSERSITSVLGSLELNPKRVIVEHNKTLIKQEDYGQHTVREGGQLELLEFVGGG